MELHLGLLRALFDCASLAGVYSLLLGRAVAKPWVIAPQLAGALVTRQVLILRQNKSSPHSLD